MKIRFKTQDYQTAAVDAVTDCFAGQPAAGARTYRIDPGPRRVAEADGQARMTALDEMAGVRNAELALTPHQLLQNVRAVQRGQNLPASEDLVTTPACGVNLDVEMETGTGKTYCYIKTMFEMNRRYGWTKFVVMVPSVAIREGVKKSFAMTAEHFLEAYGKRARAFVYDSKRLSDLEGFSSDGGINVMIINAQAFNATGKDQRRIYDEQDSFQSRKPIDVIRANRPILILDEPQKMEGARTTEAMAKFDPLMILRYSATHRTTHNKIHRLDALDAYAQKLVKKIAARGIEVRGLGGTNGYLYVEAVEVGRRGAGPTAWVELEERKKSGVKRVRRRVGKGDNLFDLSGEMEQYRDRWTVQDIDARTDTVSFVNGQALAAGRVAGDVNETHLRRLQIREAVKAHFERERALFDRGVKVLTLFFIDEVAKYRRYDDAGEKRAGEYAQVFEEEYAALKQDVLGLHADGDDGYAAFLRRDAVGDIHNGYFSIDKRKKTAGRMIDSDVARTGEMRGESKDADAYDLILKDKERLLSRAEPVRFIFSHSALREGWDNPNVFVIAVLKHSDNTVTRRQEVGRGLRIAVDQHGERLDDPAEVHAVNVLTVVTSESYHDFVKGLQGEMAAALEASGRPRKANEGYFEGKRLPAVDGAEPVAVTGPMARQIYKWLLKNDYVNDADEISDAYHAAKDAGTLAPLPEALQPHAAGVLALVDGVLNPAVLPDIDNGRGTKVNPVSPNLHKKEFLALWESINRKAAYTVRFDTDELVRKCVKSLDKKLKVQQLQYVVRRGELSPDTTAEALSRGTGFTKETSATEQETRSVGSAVTYDLLREVAVPTGLTRGTAAAILSGIEKTTFDQYPTNPEGFIQQAAGLINAEKAATVVEHLSYDAAGGEYGLDLFTRDRHGAGFADAKKVQRHVLEYVVTDSKVEKDFVDELEKAEEVEVYAKLPRGFYIPTPVGHYNPDWAIAFRAGTVKHVYFVAETKGTLESLELRGIEDAKIKCAKKFFGTLGDRGVNEGGVKYGVVNGFGKLMELVK